MANIKSAKKRVIVNRTKAERNKAIRSESKALALKVYTTKTTLQEKFPAYPKQLTLLLNSN